MDRGEVYLGVKRALTRMIGCGDDIERDSSLMRDLRVDGERGDYVLIGLGLEGEFDFLMNDEDFDRLEDAKTPDDLVTYSMQRLEAVA